MVEAYFGSNDSRRVDALSWEVTSPAKVNLFLEVGQRRTDGYHQIESLIAPISLADRIRMQVTAASGITLQTSFPSGRNEREAIDRLLPDPEQNLITRVLREFQSVTGTRTGAAIRLTKVVPLQAGLGGASSNAAFALRMANQLWKVGWPTGELGKWAAAFGSDIPFFLQNQWAICQGRGESVRSLPGGCRCPMLIAAPPVGFETGRVYSHHRPPENALTASSIEEEVTRNSGLGFARKLFNRLRDPASHLSHWVDRLYRIFGQLPQIGHQMTGSGSCHFGLFATFEAARMASLKLKQQTPECRVILCELTSRLNF